MCSGYMGMGCVPEAMADDPETALQSRSAWTSQRIQPASSFPAVTPQEQNLHIAARARR